MKDIKDKFENEVKVVDLLSEEEISEMNQLEKESYLEKLTTNQYESLPIAGGRNISAPHDYRLKRLKKRTEWVEKTVDNNLEEYEYGIGTLLNGGMNCPRFETQKVPRALDYMGSYLLKSHDVTSPRQLDEYSFYVDEREYNNHSSTKDTILMDSDESVDLFSDKDEYINIQTEEFSSRIWGLVNMLKLEEMNYQEKKKLLYRGIVEKDNPTSGLQEVMQSLYDSIVNNLQKESDKEIIDLIVAGKTEEEISLIQNCSQPNISKKVKRIVKYMGSK